MYEKYHTEALVLGNREMGEADRVVALFTRDFGLVRARASAVRTEHSKMRYAVQDYARADVSLVKGKRGWRLAGASALKSATGDRKCVSTFARIAGRTTRLCGSASRQVPLLKSFVLRASSTHSDISRPKPSKPHCSPTPHTTAS